MRDEGEGGGDERNLQDFTAMQRRPNANLGIERQIRNIFECVL